MSHRILFIGNFLSKKRGTISPAGRLIHHLRAEGIVCRSASHFSPPLLRLLHIAAACLFSRCDKLHIDTFSHRAFWFAALGTRVARWRDKPVVLNLHGGQLAEYFARHRKRVSAIFRLATTLVSPSRSLVDFFEAEGFQVQYLPNFIDLQCFQFKNPNTSNHNILWVRAFADLYRPQTAIAALALLKNDYPDATLSMVGPDLGLRAACERFAQAQGLAASVRFHGPVPNPALPFHYHSHGVFLNTSTAESFGMALLEAAACGIPMVSGKVGEIPLLWEQGKDIMLAEDLRPESFASAIAHLFENPSTAKTQSEAARRQAERFSWESVKHSWLNLLR